MNLNSLSEDQYQLILPELMESRFHENEVLSKNELSGVSWGNFREENWSEARALPFSILQVKLYSWVSKMSFAGTQAEDKPENTAKRQEVAEWLRQSFFYSFCAEEGATRARV